MEKKENSDNDKSTSEGKHPIEIIRRRERDKTKRDFDFCKVAAVFPELPNPLSPIYIRVRNLNEPTGRFAEFESEVRPKYAVEIGLKMTF